MTNKEKFLALVSGQSDAMERIRWRRENRVWLQKSQLIALHILLALDSQRLTQKQLAEQLNVSPQQVSKWVKGQENFTIETIAKIENALGLSLVRCGASEDKYSRTAPKGMALSIATHSKTKREYPVNRTLGTAVSSKAGKEHFKGLYKAA